MKLYLFETCPFCVRARMMLGLKGIPCEMEYLQGDDAETPMSLIGSKQVPILKTNEGSFLGESLDIIHYLDQLNSQPILDGRSVMPELEDWRAGVRQEIDQLCYPRYAEIKPSELQTEDAMAFFRISRKEKMGITLAEAMEKTAALCRIIEGSLNAVDSYADRYLAGGKEISVNEFFLFPILRSLTLVKALDMTATLELYVRDLSRRCQVSLYSDSAI